MNSTSSSLAPRYRAALCSLVYQSKVGPGHVSCLLVDPRDLGVSFGVLAKKAESIEALLFNDPKAATGLVAFFVLSPGTIYSRTRTDRLELSGRTRISSVV